MKNNAKVLYVDDEDRAEYLVRWLKLSHDLDVHWVKTPKEAIDAIENKKYKVVILDIMMPTDYSFSNMEKVSNQFGLLTGVLLYKEIEKMPYMKSCKVIFLSARNQSSIEEYVSVKKDYVAYFRKPIDMEELFEEIQKYL